MTAYDITGGQYDDEETPADEAEVAEAQTYLRRRSVRAAAHARSQSTRDAGNHVLVTLKGPGVFLAAEVTKQGGANDLTFVILDIDGRNVTNLSFAAAINQGLTQHNPYGLVLLQSPALKAMTVGFPAPLRYQRSLELRVTVNEANVVQILGNVVHGAA